MPKLYIPGDPNSSPYDPQMGDIVIYREFRRGHTNPEHYPAIIVRAHKDDRADLHVFAPFGQHFVTNVRYSSDDTTENTYGWLPEKVKRQVANSTVTAPADEVGA